VEDGSMKNNRGAPPIAIKQSVYNSLVVQTRLKPYFDAIALNLTAGGISTVSVALTLRWKLLKQQTIRLQNGEMYCSGMRGMMC
jgi:hypothetical protein